MKTITRKRALAVASAFVTAFITTATVSYTRAWQHSRTIDAIYAKAQVRSALDLMENNDSARGLAMWRLIGEWGTVLRNNRHAQDADRITALLTKPSHADQERIAALGRRTLALQKTGVLEITPTPLPRWNSLESDVAIIKTDLPALANNPRREDHHE